MGRLLYFILFSVLIGACSSSDTSLESSNTGTVQLQALSAELPVLKPDQYSCSPDIAINPKLPILLIHGTTLSTATTWSWSWIPALTKAGRSWCTVELVDKGMSDAQTSAERVAQAVIQTNRLSNGKKVQIVGHSQGALVPRISIRYFPEIRPLIEELVSLAGSHHGTLDAQAVCAVGRCAESIWQQRNNSNLISALNSGGLETFEGIDYTSLYSRYDQVVVPNFDSPLGSASSKLRGEGNVNNVLLQDVCPLNLAEHLGMGTFDGLTYRLAMDALEFEGPLNLTRFDASSACTELLMPGVVPSEFPVKFAALVLELATSLATAPLVTSEPELRDYIANSAN